MTQMTFLPPTIADMVEEYATAANQPILKGRYATAIQEEYGEWRDEVNVGNHSPKAELKELSDLVYVCYARAREMGYKLDEAVSLVHKNNMGRMYQPDGTILRREDGKIIKNPEYPRVYLGDLV